MRMSLQPSSFICCTGLDRPPDARALDRCDGELCWSDWRERNSSQKFGGVSGVVSELWSMISWASELSIVELETRRSGILRWKRALKLDMTEINFADFRKVLLRWLQIIDWICDKNRLKVVNYIDHLKDFILGKWNGFGDFMTIQRNI